MLACFFLGSVVAYNLVMVIYRLHFHPLNKFPGPRLAAATGLYELYFSVWGTDGFKHEIGEMHRTYGRHAPHKIEVYLALTHAKDPSFGSPPTKCMSKSQPGPAL